MKNNFFEKIQLEETEKEFSSDRCLEQAITYISDFKKFYESDFVKETSMEKYGFSKQEQEKILGLAEKLKSNILDEYENNEKLLVSGDSQFKHLAGNSTMVFAGGQARRYESGKTISEEFRKKIKNQIELLNYYIQELVENKELLQDELTLKNGHLQKFSKYFSSEVVSESPKRILVFKFFRDLEKQGILKKNFSHRLEEIDEETKIKNFLDIKKLEQEGLILVKENDDEIYKYV
ncbi:MAG: hypothetical protein U9O55_00650 [Patescibacteria group bacterium]|nr:hypothetical protein [Patescibacteria group bacterium]